MSDSSDTEETSRQELLKRYKNHPDVKKYEKYLTSMENYLKDTNGKDIDEILKETIVTFFQLKPKIGVDKLSELINRLALLYNKLRQISFFNLMIAYCHFLQKISKYIGSDRTDLLFNPKKDLISNAKYDIELNKNLTHKIFKLAITSTSPEKFNYLKQKLEFYIYKNNDPFVEYDLVVGPYPDGYTVSINMRDNYLILNDESNKETLIQEMKSLFKKYGINENYINWWKNNSYSRIVQNYEENQEESNDNDKNKKDKVIKKYIDEEEKKLIKERNKEKWAQTIKNLITQENNIKNNFKLTKRNFSPFKNSFMLLKKIIMSIDNLSCKIKNIYPYGSITQLTQNITSDYEISIITENYSNINNKQVITLFTEIQNYIEKKYKKAFKIISIRETKRTALLIINDQINNLSIEINCNNFFSIMNSNLIYIYLTYDARALILVNTIKDWSKIKGINSNHEGFMSSYCYTLMTIFFLQRMHKPLLPILTSNIFDKIKVKNYEYFIEKNLLNPAKSFKNWKCINTEDTITTLLLKFFVFYLYLFNEDDYCIDISNDKLTFRYYEAKYLNYFHDRNKVSAYCFIDMFDYTYNPGSYMDKDSTPHSLYKKKLEKSLAQLLNGEDYLLKPDYEIGEKKDNVNNNK